MHVLVTGANGTLGHVMMNTLKKQKIKATGFDRQRVNPEDPLAVEAFLNELQPTVIYHLAKSSLSFTQTLAAWALNHKVRLVFTSSFKVFSGKKVEGPYRIFDVPDGTDSFAKDKIAQERLLFQYYPYTYVVRLAWQIAQEPKGYNLLSFVKEQIDKRGPFPAARDHFISFMFIEDTVEALLKVPTTVPSGLYHLNANDNFSMFDVLSYLKETQDYPWLEFNDSKRYAHNDLMQSNLPVKTFSEYGFKFLNKL